MPDDNEKELREKMAKVRDPGVYVPVYGTDEAERLRIVGDRAAFAQDAPQRRTSRGVTLGPASLEKRSEADSVPARAIRKVQAGSAKKKELTPEELKALADQMLQQMRATHEAQMSAGPAVGPSVPPRMVAPTRPRQPAQALPSQASPYRPAAAKTSVQPTGQNVEQYWHQWKETPSSYDSLTKGQSVPKPKKIGTGKMKPLDPAALKAWQRKGVGSGMTESFPGQGTVSYPKGWHGPMLQGDWKALEFSEDEDLDYSPGRYDL